MWKPEHRRAANRRGLRYPSDLTDAEWTLVAPTIPLAKRGGCRRAVDVREVLNAIFYVLSTGCQWAALLKDLPPKSTAHAYFMLWEWDGTLERLHHALYVATRERGEEARTRRDREQVADGEERGRQDRRDQRDRDQERSRSPHIARPTEEIAPCTRRRPVVARSSMVRAFAP